MGERKTGVAISSPEDLEQEVARIREDIEPVARELDRRRHAMMDWRTQVKKRAPKAARFVAVALGVVTAVKTIRHRRAQRKAATA